MGVTIIIILFILALIAALVLVFFLKYNKLKYLYDKTLYAQKLIKDELEKKLSCLTKINSQAKKTLRAKKDYLNNISEINIENESPLEIDKQLSSYNVTVNNLLSDYTKLANNKEIKKSVDNLFEIDEKLDAAKTYFNSSTAKLLSASQKFPANVIAKISRLKVKPLFQTNEDVKKENVEL